MTPLVSEAVHPFALDGSDGPAAVLAGPGGLVGVGGGFASITALVVLLVVVALLVAVARLMTRCRPSRGAAPVVAELDERAVRGGGSL